MSRPVKDEVRANAMARMAAGEPIVTGLLGYEDTVLPQLENALLAGHDVIFLGERGQAKTRIIRSLVDLLDEWMPIVAGSEINDDPYDPVSKPARDLVAEHGDDTPIEWVHRSRRFGEKLATPDTAIADLIGEVDPIRVAEGRYLADELTIHYGLVPRTNRGIFAINELPDLAERIQVGLLNVLEERDVQIRGYKVRLPLDVMLVASANPEDYTNRGRIITPLKDRFGAQIRTHYPIDARHRDGRGGPGGPPASTPPGVQVTVPGLHGRDRGRHHPPGPPLAARSTSGPGVSVAAVDRQPGDAGGQRPAPGAAPRRDRRPCPGSATWRRSSPPPPGKVEIETLEEGRDGEIVDRLVKGAVLETWRAVVPARAVRATSSPPSTSGLAVDTGDDVPRRPTPALADLPGIKETLGDLEVGEAPAEVASAVEFVLEGLHLSKRLNKDAQAGRATAYRRPVLSPVDLPKPGAVRRRRPE